MYVSLVMSLFSAPMQNAKMLRQRRKQMFADVMQERRQRLGKQYQPTLPRDQPTPTPHRVQPTLTPHRVQPIPLPTTHLPELLPTTRFPDRLPTPTPPRAQPTQTQIEKNRKLIQLKVQCRNDFEIAKQLRAEEDAKYQQISRDYKLAQQIHRDSRQRM